MLIETPTGILNTAQIASVKAERSEEWDERCTVTFLDGRTETLDCSVGLFEKACGTLVPVQPGFVLIRAVFPGEDEPGAEIRYLEEPVIAFRLVGLGEPIPVTLSGEPDAVEGARWCVRQPTGDCVSPHAGHESVEAFRARCRGERDLEAASPAQAS